ncbi:MAG: ADP-ribosylglycohydrolase family protein [Candidatus Heimdallarchaeota archaeon]|nr:ADP-ribosylglycohydrolase family protein [Candidatus Heimdallarchaeota archaeon]
MNLVDITFRPTKSKYAGCLIGKAVGDALGFLVEGQSAEVCQKYLSTFDDNTIPKVKRAQFEYGQYSDDTQLARELIISFLENKSFDPKLYGKKISKLFYEGKVVGGGMATRNSAERLRRRVPWYAAGEPRPSAGNGTAMRAAVVSLMFYPNVVRLREVATNQSRITHLDPRCTVGSVTIALATHAILKKHSKTLFSAAELIEPIIPSIDQTSPLFAEELKNLIEWTLIDPKEALEKIRIAGKPDFDDGWPGISPYVIPTVLWSLYCFIRNQTNFLQAVKLAIWCGGDVDTTAAITGALVGARVGVEFIPPNLILPLNDRGNWKSRDLRDLCYDLYNQVF